MDVCCPLCCLWSYLRIPCCLGGALHWHQGYNQIISPFFLQVAGCKPRVGAVTGIICCSWTSVEGTHGTQAQGFALTLTHHCSSCPQQSFPQNHCRAFLVLISCLVGTGSSCPGLYPAGRRGRQAQNIWTGLEGLGDWTGKSPRESQELSPGNPNILPRVKEFHSPFYQKSPCSPKATALWVLSCAELWTSPWWHILSTVVGLEGPLCFTAWVCGAKSVGFSGLWLSVTLVKVLKVNKT